MSMYTKIQKNIASYYGSLQQQYSAKYLKEAMIGLGLLVALGGGYVLNRWYTQHREQKAFEALSEVVHSFSQTQRLTQSLDPVKDKDKIDQSWSDTLLLLDALYKEHMGSSLAPYFLVFKAQVVLEKDHNLDDSIKILDEALPHMSKNSELGSLFSLKRIKMGFDSQDQKIKDQAFRDLERVAQDSSSFAQQEAQYLLGVYYVSQGQIAKAQETWKKLIDASDATALVPSPWVKLAQEKLGLLS